MVWVDEIPQPFAGELNKVESLRCRSNGFNIQVPPNNSSAQHFNAAPPNSSRPAKLFQQAVEFEFSTGGAARGRSQKVLTRGGSLALLVKSPAQRRAVQPDAASEQRAATYTDESLAHWRIRLPVLVGAPAFHRTIGL